MKRLALATVSTGLALAAPVGVAPAVAQETDDRSSWSCAIIGHRAQNGSDSEAVRDEISKLDIFSMSGVSLERTDQWVVPAGSDLLVTVESDAPLSGVTVEAYLLGVRIHRYEEMSDAPQPRYTAPVAPPLLDGLTRTLGVRVESGPCAATTAVMVDRSLWSTPAGLFGVVFTALTAAALVTVARWRRGGWPRRFLWAAPVGLLAGAGEVFLLHESGRADPFGLTWWPFLVGLALAALLPLTRRRRDRLAASHGLEVFTVRRLMSSGAALTGPQVVTLVLGVLDALAAAHARGVVRGVRPETVWLDRDGRVWLADPAPPASPYASPEQVAGRPGDARSDVWACGVMLVELLTGRPHVPPILPALPTPLAEVVGRALAADPAQRFASAQEFAAALRVAARREWGPDWVGRGALATASLAHGALGSAAAGYAAAGLGAGTSTGTAGFGAAAPSGSGALGSAGTALTGGTGGFGSAAPASGTPAATAPSTGAAAGKAGTLVSVGAAAAAVVAVGAGAVLTDAGPAQARVPVITPEQARLVTVRTLDEVRSEQTDRLDERVADEVYFLHLAYEDLPEATVAEVAVGVPPGQYEFPAWFVASAQLRRADGVVHLFGRFERAEESAYWRMTNLMWSVDEPVGTPRLDDDGWLSPAPSPEELIVDPAELPRRYADWSQASFEARRHVEDDLLRTNDPGLGETVRDYRLREAGEIREDESITQEVLFDDAEPTAIWLDDGRALVWFTVTNRQTSFNTPEPGETVPCDEGGAFVWYPEPDVRYRQLSYYGVVLVTAWVPARGGETTVLISDPLPTQYVDLEHSVRC